jgi:hypothetical protein
LKSSAGRIRLTIPIGEFSPRKARFLISPAATRKRGNIMRLRGNMAEAEAIAKEGRSPRGGDCQCRLPEADAGEADSVENRA